MTGFGGNFRYLRKTQFATPEQTKRANRVGNLAGTAVVLLTDALSLVRDERDEWSVKDDRPLAANAGRVAKE